MSKKRSIINFLVALTLIIFSLLGFIIINHYVRLRSEYKFLKPIGEMISVNDHNMHVFVEGSGETTLVFLSGYGTLVPCYDFAPLYNELVDKYQIAVIERAGYGYSEETENSRDIDTVVEENREALRLTGVEGSVVIVSHSMSGLEALYWAQKYPNEVKAIVGLDAAFPDWYLQDDPEEREKSISKDEWLSRLMRIGFIRFNPEISELANKNDDEAKALMYKDLYNLTLINEEKALYNNASSILEKGLPTQIPVLCFVSNGNDISPEWRQKSLDFWSQFEGNNCSLLDVGHYVHLEATERIAKDIIEFVEKL